MVKRRQSPVEPEIVESMICTTEYRLEIIQNIPFFSDLQSDAIQRINERFTEKGYQAGEFIYMAGQEARRLYVVASGKVKLLRHTLDGQEIMLDILAPGEHFGSLLALGDDTYSDTAQAQTGVCVLSINSTEFRNIMEAYPAATFKVLDIVNERLRQSQEMVRQLSAYTVEERIAYALLKIADKFGETHEEGLLIQVPLSREELAAMIGTTTESTSRVMSRFQKEGIINSGRQWIAIADRERLQTLSKGQ